jgi:hypothetical protein
VDELIDLVKNKLKKLTKLKKLEKVSKKAIILRKGSKDLKLNTPISELYNTENEALEVIIDGRHYINRI